MQTNLSFDLNVKDCIIYLLCFRVVDMDFGYEMSWWLIMF